MALLNRLYPHLMPTEIPIWEQWLKTYEQEYNRFDYDVRVGESITPPPTVDANICAMAVSLAKKRIDVVGWKNDQPTIIEIKDYVGLTALGQMFSYPLLYQWEFPETKPPELLLIATRFLPDTKTILDFYTIPYIEITIPGSPSQPEGRPS